MLKKDPKYVANKITRQILQVLYNDKQELQNIISFTGHTVLIVENDVMKSFIL